MKRLFLCLVALLLIAFHTASLHAQDPSGADSVYVYYTSEDDTRTRHFYRLDVNNGQSDDLAQLAPADAIFGGHSADGTWLYFTQANADGFTDLYRMSLDGQVWENISRTPHLNEEFLGAAGEWIFFIRRESTQYLANVYRARVDGSGSQNLSQTPHGGQYNYRWSSDGTWFFWERNLDDSAYDLLMGHYAPTNTLYALEGIQEYDNLSYLDVSSDGQSLYHSYVSFSHTPAPDATYTIWRFSVNDGQLREFSPTFDQPLYVHGDSPDNRYFYFSADTDEIERIFYIMPSDGTASPRPLFEAISVEFFLFFSPDGEWALIQSDWLSYRIRIDGSDLSPLEEVAYYGWTPQNQLIIQRDADYFLLNTDDTSSSLPLPESAYIHTLVGNYLIYRSKDDLYHSLNLNNFHDDAFPIVGNHPRFVYVAAKPLLSTTLPLSNLLIIPLFFTYTSTRAGGLKSA